MATLVVSMTPLGPSDLQPAINLPLAIQGQFQMTSRSQVSSDSLLILHFILELLEASGSPACLLYKYMKTFIVSDDVVLEEVMFNLCDVARQGTHEKQINQLVQHLSDRPTQRVVIFITTHSHDLTGDLYVSPDSCALVSEVSS